MDMNNKKQQFYVITPEQKQELQVLASKLPKLPKMIKDKKGNDRPVLFNMSILGGTFKRFQKDVTKHTLRDGSDIEDNTRYVMDNVDYMYVEHEKNLISAAMVYGPKGVLDYCTRIKDEYKVWLSKKDEFESKLKK